MAIQEPTQSDRRHVFCVNSDPYLRAILHEVLEEERYCVTTTNFLPGTFDQIEALQPSLLIIDVSYVRQAGWDLLQDLTGAAATRRIPVVAVSSDPKLIDRAAADGRDLHAQRVLTKPFDLDEMVGTIRSLIGPA